MSRLWRSPVAGPSLHRSRRRAGAGISGRRPRQGLARRARPRDDAGSRAAGLQHRRGQGRPDGSRGGVRRAGPAEEPAGDSRHPVRDRQRDEELRGRGRPAAGRAGQADAGRPGVVLPAARAGSPRPADHHPPPADPQPGRPQPGNLDHPDLEGAGERHRDPHEQCRRLLPVRERREGRDRLRPRRALLLQQRVVAHAGGHRPGAIGDPVPPLRQGAGDEPARHDAIDLRHGRRLPRPRSPRAPQAGQVRAGSGAVSVPEPRRQPGLQLPVGRRGDRRARRTRWRDT